MINQKDLPSKNLIKKDLANLLLEVHPNSTRQNLVKKMILETGKNTQKALVLNFF